MYLDNLGDIVDEFSSKYYDAHDNVFEYVKKHYHEMSDTELDNLMISLRSMDEMAQCFIKFANIVIVEEKRRCPYER